MHKSIAEARQLAMEGNFLEAENMLLSAVKVKPRDAELYNALGIISGMRGDVRTAQRYFEEAIRVRPKLAASYGNLGRLFAEQGDRLKALEYYLRTLELDYRNASAWNNLVVELKLVGLHQEATHALSRAIKIGVNFPLDFLHAHRNSGQDCGNTGDSIGAIRRLFIAQETSEDTAEQQLEHFLRRLHRQIGMKHKDVTRSSDEPSGTHRAPTRAEIEEKRMRLYALCGAGAMGGVVAAVLIVAYFVKWEWMLGAMCVGFFAGIIIPFWIWILIHGDLDSYLD